MQCLYNVPRWRPAAVLDLIEPEIALFDPPTLKTLHRTKCEVDWMILCGDMAIQNSTYHEECIWDPNFEGRGGRRQSSIVPLEKAMVVSYKLPIVTVALSLTIRLQIAIECLRRSIQQGVDHNSDQNIRCFLWSSSGMLESARSERPMLTSREIIFKDFRPM